MKPRVGQQDDGDRMERWADGVLGALPEPTAPHDLLASILERVRREQAVPWHRRPWHAWPTALRWASALALAVVLGLAWSRGDEAIRAVARALHQVDAVRVAHETVARVLDAGGACLGAVGHVVQSLPRTATLAAASVLVALWISTLGLGAALWRLLRTSS